MTQKTKAVPDEVLSKEFLSQFKTESDVSRFLKQLHAQVLEKMLEGEMDTHLGYEKHSVAGNNSGNSRNGSYPKKIQTEHGESVISIPRDRKGEFDPIVCPKHESRGLSIEKLVISLYAKGMSISDIEEEMCKSTFSLYKLQVFFMQRTLLNPCAQPLENNLSDVSRG